MIRSTSLAVLLCCLALAGCVGGPDPAEAGTPTDTTTTAPTATVSPATTQGPTTRCRPTGGYLLKAVPVDADAPARSDVAAYENLTASQQGVFDEMRRAYYRGHPGLPEGYPDYVRYDGTVYEPKKRGHWDDFC